jgi:hypothetical protein
MILAGLTSVATASTSGESACGGYSVGIVDETRSMHSRPAAANMADITDLNFKEFVGAVSSHVLTAVCAGAGASDTDVHLLFIKRPLVKQTGEAPDNLPTADKHGGPDLRRLNSPWVKLEIGGQPVRRIDAVFVWNERQVLRDQAAMAGGAPVDSGAAASFDAAVLARYSEEYANSVVLAPPQARKAALDRLATGMPPEILWLYRHAVQSTLDDFSVFTMEALDATLFKTGKAYATIAIALFDRCFGSAAGTSERYGNILDLKNITDTDPYRIETLF